MGRLLKAHLLSVWEILPDTRNSAVGTVTDALLSLLSVALQPEAVMTPQMEQARNQAHRDGGKAGSNQGEEGLPDWHHWIRGL